MSSDGSSSPDSSPPAPPSSDSSPPNDSPPQSSPPPSSPPPSSPSPPKESPQSNDSSPPPHKDSSPPPPNDSNQSNGSHNNNNNSNNAHPTAPSRGNSTAATPTTFTPPAPEHSRPAAAAGALSHPPPARSTPSPPQQDKSNDTSVATSKIIGGVVAGGLVIIVLLLVICVLCIRRKKRRRDEHMQYYGASRKGGGDYYNSVQQQNAWHKHNMNHPMGTDHGVRLNQQAGGGAMGQPVGSWISPSHQMPLSGEMSSNFSGQRGPPLPPPTPPMALGFNKSTFTYDELAAATNGFSQAQLLGQGGFGYVHKGVLPNGKEVAVKSLKSGSGQGEREFAAEVEIISRVHHRHLVSLVGYCIAGGQRMLVYEFVANNTMEYHLHGKGLPPMEWSTRLRIAIGSAKGLAYLHEDCHPKIIHRDIKSANILLDNNFEAMVADFGLAKLSSDNNTHVSTRVMGTFGYLAPEYASSGKLTEKSDVFSYGVMLLELITGKRPVDPSHAMEDSLVDWARPLLTKALEDGSNYVELVDIRLDNNYNQQEMARMVACAAASIRHSSRKRPKMSQIVRALEGDVSLDDLNEGTKPGQTTVHNIMGSGGGGSSDYDTQAYNADMKKFRKLALSSQEFGSSEYGTSSNDSREIPTPQNQKQQQYL